MCQNPTIFSFLRGRLSSFFPFFPFSSWFRDKFSRVINGFQACKLWLSARSQIAARYLLSSPPSEDDDEYKPTTTIIPGLHRLMSPSCLKITMTGKELTSLSFLGGGEGEGWADIPLSSPLLTEPLFCRSQADESLRSETGDGGISNKFTVDISYPVLFGTTRWYPKPAVCFSPDDINKRKVMDVIEAMKKVFLEEYWDEAEGSTPVFEIVLSHICEKGEFAVVGIIDQVEESPISLGIKEDEGSGGWGEAVGTDNGWGDVNNTDTWSS
ncbi:hypothetical protein TWF481_012273 [Arthrobotrys musiformis]|uniref:Uncharacterized protein n=1 Tax=Arthrobotrys musiformis TaxID=47236 RepID=A0AAV9VWM2_9PEZI